MSNCPICGKPTSSLYGNERKAKLCREHAQDFKNGKIVQCEKCGEWHDVHSNCKCNQEKEKIIYINNPDTCIICGSETDNGYHFCRDCYYKYNDKEILLRIKRCASSEVLDSKYFNKKIISEDGHIVKSDEEARIDDYLYNHKIQHKYEKEYLPNNPKYEKSIYPDWKLPNYENLGDVYIEYWGVENNPVYDKQKEYKMEIYKEDKLTLISLYPNDLKNLSETLEKILKRCKKGEIND